MTTRVTRILFLAALTAALVAPEAWAQRRDQAPPFTPGWAGPQLEARPGSGPPGTEVRISGARFRDGVRVYYGDQPMRIVDRRDRVIVAVIPRGARDDRHIYVVDPSGRARTEVRFRLGPDPRFRDPRFEDPRFRDPRFDRRRGAPGRVRPVLEARPARGEPGTRVLLSGRRFARDATPYYGNQRMRVLRRGERFILAEIPRRAGRDQFIYVVDRRGQARTARRFELFSPRRVW
jgi:hypothetical protein